MEGQGCPCPTCSPTGMLSQAVSQGVYSTRRRYWPLSRALGTSWIVWLSGHKEPMAPATTLLSTPPLVLGPLDAPTSSLRPCSRHRDDAEVQPVPGVPEEREVIDAETPGQHLNEGLKGVDPREGVPGKKRTGHGRVSHLGMCTHTTTVQRRRRDTKIADGYPGLGTSERVRGRPPRLVSRCCAVGTVCLP